MPNEIDKSIEKELKKRKSPVPANYERIKEGALNLILKDRAVLADILKRSCAEEIQRQEDELIAAKEMLK